MDNKSIISSKLNNNEIHSIYYLIVILSYKPSFFSYIIHLQNNLLIICYPLLCNQNFYFSTYTCVKNLSKNNNWDTHIKRKNDLWFEILRFHELRETLWYQYFGNEWNRKVEMHKYFHKHEKSSIFSNSL